MSSRRIRLMDGGFSQALKDKDYNVDEMKLWTGEANRYRPDLVLAVYKDWLLAGVDVITTNTYHTLLPLLKKLHRDNEVDDFNKPAIKMLNAAFNEIRPRRKVETLASMGCYGATNRDASEYHGNYVDEENYFKKIMDFYVYETDKLEAYGYRRIIIETVPALEEAVIIKYMIELSLSTFTISFTCKDGEHLRHGEKFSDAVELLISHPKITGIGVNCTEYPYVTPLLKSIQGKTMGKEVFVYPNSGMHNGPRLDELSDEQLNSLVKEWISYGATVIGGCCGVGVPLIKRLRRALDTPST